MSRLYLALFWLAGLITLAASIEFQCFVNHLVDTPSGHNSASEPREERSGQNQIIAHAAPQNTTSDNDRTGTHTKTSNDPEHRTADAEENMALATWVGSVFTGLAFLGLFYTLYLTWTQTKELKETNRVMRETHNAERRPWLSIAVGVQPPGFRPIEAFNLEPTAPNMMGIQFNITCKNHGESPASNVQIASELMTIFLEDTSREEMIKEIGDNARNAPKVDGVTIFPGEAYKFVWIQRIDVRQFDVVPKEAMCAFFYRGVVNYCSAHTKGHRQTRFGYNLGASDRGQCDPFPCDFTKLENLKAAIFLPAWVIAD